MPNRPRDRVRVALLDGSAARIEAVRAWFAAHEPALEVVAAARSWAELVHDRAFPTDVVVMAVSVPGPVSVQSRIRTCRAAGAKVVVCCADEAGGTDGRAAVALGAAACVHSSQPPYEVATVVRAVTGVRPPAAAGAATAVPGPGLSDGERRALILYAAGLTAKQVALRMNVRYETVKTYLRRARRKYAAAGRPAGTRAELQRRALEDGVLG